MRPFYWWMGFGLAAALGAQVWASGQHGAAMFTVWCGLNSLRYLIEFAVQEALRLAKDV
jgi:hypothetical protein